MGSPIEAVVGTPAKIDVRVGAACTVFAFRRGYARTLCIRDANRASCVLLSFVADAKLFGLEMRTLASWDTI
jgi:hypothetical protein